MSTSRTTKRKSSASLWRLGRHRLLLGDATKKEDVSRLVGSEKVSLVLTDPPYGVGYVEGKRDFLKSATGSSGIPFEPIKGDAVTDDYYRFSCDWLTAMKPHLAKKNSLYVFNGDTKLRELLNAFHDEGFTKSGLLVWLKDRFVVGRKDYHPQHELILYGWLGTHAWHGNKDRTALFYPKPAKNALHPTMKPPALLRRLIYHGSAPNDTVLDPFGGSGSTLIACEHLGRQCFMMEMDDRYCRSIVARWEKLTGEKAVPVDA